MMVYVVFVELPGGDEIGYVHGVYATEDLAQIAAKAEYDDRIAREERPWVVEGGDEGEYDEDWEFDLHVHAHEVHRS